MESVPYCSWNGISAWSAPLSVSVQGRKNGGVLGGGGEEQIAECRDGRIQSEYDMSSARDVTARVCVCTPNIVSDLPAVCGEGHRICWRITKPARHFSTHKYERPHRIGTSVRDFTMTHYLFIIIGRILAPKSAVSNLLLPSRVKKNGSAGRTRHAFSKAGQ